MRFDPFLRSIFRARLGVIPVVLFVEASVSSDAQALPTQYMRGRDFRSSVTRRGTRYLIVGSGKFRMQDWLEPTDARSEAGVAYPSVAAFRASLAAEDETRREERERIDITAASDSIDVVVGGGARPPKETRLLEIALRLQAELARRHPHRRYVVIYDAETTYVDSWLWFMSKWRIGRLEIRRSLNLESSTAVAVRADERRMDDPSFVDSDVMRYALLLALSFEAKLARLSWLLGRPRAFDEQQARTGRWLITALLVDLAEKQDSLRRGHGRVDTPLLERRLSYLVRLRGFALAAPRDADEAKWSLLVELCAGIRALASSALAHAQLQERTQLETQARLALSHARDREAMQLPSADAS